MQARAEEPAKARGSRVPQEVWVACTGRFRLQVALPLEIDPDAVSADLDHGVLTITVPRAARARRRRIPVGRP